MRKEQLEYYASDLEIQNDEMAYLLMQVKRLIHLQPICDFDVWWMRDVSPLLMNEKTIDFLIHHMDRFKRKITAREFIVYDMIIKHGDPETFDEFRIMIQKNQFERDIESREKNPHFKIKDDNQKRPISNNQS